MVGILEKAQAQSGIFRRILFVEVLYAASQDAGVRPYALMQEDAEQNNGTQFEKIINTLFNQSAEPHNSRNKFPLLFRPPLLYRCHWVFCCGVFVFKKRNILFYPV
jgi:hypothetical protein